MGNVCTTSSKPLLNNFKVPVPRSSSTTYRSPQVEEIYKAYLSAKKRVKQNFIERSNSTFLILKKVDWIKEVKKAAEEGYSALRITSDLTKKDTERFAKIVYRLFGDGIYLYKEGHYIHLYWDVSNYDKQIPVKKFILPDY